MKNLMIIGFMLLVPFVVFSQDKTRVSPREKRVQRELQVKNEVAKAVERRNFVFVPSQATPMTGGAIQLSGYFSIAVKGDSVFSNLPYYGVAYHVDYGLTRSPLYFNSPLNDYTGKIKKQVYKISFNVPVRSDKIKLNFDISESGYTSLQVTSLQRQPISFYGRIEPGK